MFKRRRRGTRLFFATDIHGSEECFRKWLNAGPVYEVNALILGGDITGKVLAPIVATSDGYATEMFGRQVTCQSDGELETLQKQLRRIGPLRHCDHA